MKNGILVVLAVLCASWAGAATVLLKDGGRLEGTVLRESDGQLVLQTAQGTVSIPSEKILRVEAAPAPPAAAQQAPPPAQELPPPQAPREFRRRLSQEELFGPLSQSLSLELGLAAPLSGVNFYGIGGGSGSNGDVGPLVGLQYLHDLSPRWAAGAEFHYANRSATDSPDLLPNADAHVFGDTVLLMGVVKYSLTDRGSVRPYVSAAAGAHHTTTTIDARPDPGSAWSDTGTDEPRRLVDGDAWGFASSARLGLDFEIGPPAVFSLEAGWTWLSSANYGATADGQALGLSGVSGPVDYFTFAARWGWRF